MSEIRNKDLEELFELKLVCDNTYNDYMQAKLEKRDCAREEMNYALSEIRLLDYIDDLEELYYDKA